MHKITLNKLGPINHCEILCKKSIVFTGIQASGKSTLVKAIYFFRTIKDDILSIMKDQALYEANIVTEEVQDIKRTLETKLREKFLRVFGSSWGMENDMFMEYEFSAGRFIRIFLKEETTYSTPNYIWVDMSNDIIRFLRGKNKSMKASELGVTEQDEELAKKELWTFFNDPYDIVYIPAGRSFITLLSSQLNIIYSQMDRIQRRSLDYCTQDYLERILRLKPEFSNGLEGLIERVSYSGYKLKDTKYPLNLIKNILKGIYQYSDGEEKLLLNKNKYVKINFASSGQQEAVWILNLLFYYLLQKEPVSFIVEEPESHLFPESQKYMTEFIALMHHFGYPVLVTTHSPYVLGTLNNLLYAGSFPQKSQSEVSKIIPEVCWLSDSDFDAWFVENGGVVNCMDKEIRLIQNERIDGISKTINQDYDKLFNIQYASEE